MFEDSTFESTGRIRTRSRGWMLATFAFNGAILLAMILIPLIYPEALPRMVSSVLMIVPPQQQTPPPARPQPVRGPQPSSEMMGPLILAPPRIPAQPYIPSSPEPPSVGNVAELGGGPAVGSGAPFGGHGSQPTVREAPPTRARISSGVMNGLLVRKTLPTYPALAKAMGVEGTVVLQATISKTGAIENLHVVSGPAMLQQAALDAVSTWLYRPYLLNGQPVEVETTVNVVFNLH